tara:strand:+ start:535 stop:912 length:378 start_codon:yes stop_codon:yes gene_type:complete
MKTYVWHFLMDNKDQSLAKDLAQRFKSRRVEKHLTQTQVASMLGVDQPTIARYERLERQIPATLLPKIAEALEFDSIDDFLGIMHLKKRGPTPKLLKRVEALNDLPKRDLDYLLETIDRVIAQSK